MNAATTASPFEPITFVAVVNDFAELDQNLMASPVAASERHEWIVFDNTDNRLSDSISRLYCEAQARAAHDLIFFVHQDVYIPSEWEDSLFTAIAELEAVDPDWGVLGAVGVSKTLSDRALRGHWADPHRDAPQCLGPLPAEVSSLDELWLGLRKRRGLSFDPKLPGFHCYGIDLSLTAASRGLRSYAIDSFVIHKYRNQDGARIRSKFDCPKMMRRNTPEFQAQRKLSKDYVGWKWFAELPFQSTSMVWRRCDYDSDDGARLAIISPRD